MLDVRKKYILHLDPIVNGYVSKDKISADLSVIKNIVWYSVMENPLDSEVPNILPGWQIIDHESFLSVYNTNLPHQEYGNDCGIFIVMYFWHLSHGSKFDFSTKDKPQIRNWCFSLLVQRTVYEEASLSMPWLLSKMSSDRMGCLTLKDIEIDGHLNNILHVTIWLEENKEMFQSLPNNTPILQYSQNEQNDIIARLENCSTLTKEGKDNPIDEYEYLNDLCSFTFYVKKDFDIFLDIMIKTKWNVNIKLG